MTASMLRIVIFNPFKNMKIQNGSPWSNNELLGFLHSADTGVLQ